MNAKIYTKKKPLVVAISITLLATSNIAIASEVLVHPNTQWQPIADGESHTINDAKPGDRYILINGRIEHTSFSGTSNLTVNEGMLKNSAESRDNIFNDTSTATITQGRSIGDTFSNSAGQFLGWEHNDTLEAVNSFDGEYHDDAYQIAYTNSESQGNQFFDNTKQWITDDAQSMQNSFSGNSSQVLTQGDKTNAAGPSSTDDNFSGSSRQLASGTGDILRAIFTDSARQELAGAAQSKQGSFSKQSVQSIGDGSESINDKFFDSASQTVHNGGSATGTTFSGNASQVLEDGAKSENTTFNGNASGIVGANAQMLGNTTLNGSSLLSVIAQDASHGFPNSQQLNNVIINNDSTMLIAPTGSAAHLVRAGNITLNGGTIAFGHDKGSEYTALSAKEVNG
ncbi:hypothetical protein N5C39_24575, partial [Enterobacter bugandensis]